MANDIKPQDLLPTLLQDIEKLSGRLTKVTPLHVAPLPGRTWTLSGKPALGKQVYRALINLGFLPTHVDALYVYGGVRKDHQWVTSVTYNSLVGVTVIHTTIPEKMLTVEAPSRLKGK